MIEEKRAGKSPRQVTALFYEHATRPKNIGAIEEADGVGEYAHGCGDTVKAFLKIKENRITEVRYLPRSCVNTLACVSLASTLIEGRPPLEARRLIRPEAIFEALGCLPPGELHCAEIAAKAFWAALDDAIANRREPWKKLYRTRS